MAAIAAVHSRRGTQAEAVAAADAAVAVLRPAVPVPYPVPGSAVDSAAGGPSYRDTGVMGMALNEGSAHAQRVFEALRKAEGGVDRIPASAFFGQPGFRGKYGFYTAAQSTDLASIALWCVLIAAFPIGLPLALWVQIATPILARRTSFSVEGGQIVLRYGFLSKRTERIELYWVSNVTHQQMHFQKKRGEASILVALDGGPWRGHVLCVPGVVPAAHAEAFCRCIRTAAQHVRKSPGVLYATLPPN